MDTPTLMVAEPKSKYKADKKRELYKAKISEDFVLLEDILFNTPSGAASFVCGASTNGNVEWKTSDGITLKVLDEQDM